MPGGRKHTKTEMEGVLAKVAQLDRQGCNQFQIAAAVGVTQPCVCQYLKKIRERYAETTLRERGELVAEKLAQYRDALRELHEAWEGAKKDAVTVEVEEVPVEDCAVCGGSGERPEKKVGKRVTPAGPCGACNGKGQIGGVTKIVTTIENRLPAAAYFGLILRILKAERELLGLDAPKVDKEPVTSDNWHVLLDYVPPGPVPDEVEERIYSSGSTPSPDEAVTARPA